jgi:sarcosine oxidase subunit beta
MRKEIVIIGAGSTGLFTAYHLSKLGMKDVVIIDKNFAGYGSTGRCGSGIRAQFSNRENILFMSQAIRLWKDLSRELGFDFVEGGYLYLLYSREMLEKYEKLAKLHCSLGLKTRTISPDEIDEINPYINTDNLMGANFNPEDGKADPFEVLIRLRKKVLDSGIDLWERTDVRKIHTKNNEIGGVDTTRGKIETSKILNATNAWAPEIGKMFGIKVPILPFKHQIGVTEPFKAGAIKPMVLAPEVDDAYLTQSQDGGIIGGISPRPEQKPGYNMKESLEFEIRFARATTAIMPFLKHARLIRNWAGYYAMTPDNNPLIGEFKVRGHFIAAGYSGHGYMMSPLVGKALAELMLKGKSSVPLDFFDPERIERGELRLEEMKIG